MISNIRNIILVIIFSTTYISAQLPQLIQKEASAFFLSLSNNEKSYPDRFEDLYKTLNSEISKDSLENIYLTSAELYSELKNNLYEIKNTADNISSDSALVLFNNWYLKFENTFYKYFKEQFYFIKKPKIIFFSASVSCACTMEMCRNQLKDILEFVKNSNDNYFYWVVDSYENNELQIKYDTYFTPSVILFNSKNEIKYKIEYDENMISKLKKFTTGKGNL